jgi:hypothetical protein
MDTVTLHGRYVVDVKKVAAARGEVSAKLNDEAGFVATWVGAVRVVDGVLDYAREATVLEKRRCERGIGSGLYWRCEWLVSVYRAKTRVVYGSSSAQSDELGGPAPGGS